MDRLPALSALVVACLVASVVACDKSDAPPPATGRANTATVVAKKSDAAAFCDKTYAAETAPALPVPALAGGALAPIAKWRWINVWATWCKPCVDEIPRLVKWQQQLGYDLQLVSVDEEQSDVDAFRKLHPATPASLRLAQADTQAAWFTQLGLDAAAPIPVHVLVDPSNHVRCVRAGGVREQDLPLVKALLGK